jgi:RNA polymerase sigma-32 factor
MAKSLTYPAVPTEGGMSQYFREIWRFPILEKEEEQMLGIRLREEGDMDAAHALVTSHLRLVVKIAMKYRGYGLPIGDLVSEGNIGLMRAVKKFDPDMGFRLSTYAMWWIRASITEFVLKSWSLVKMGTVSSQKKLFFSLRNLKAKLNILDSGELSTDQLDTLSDKLKSSPEEIANMNRRLAVRDLSLNAPMSQDGEEGAEFIDSLVDERPSPEHIYAQREEGMYNGKLLAQAVAELPERERDIFTQRRLNEDPPTLEQIGVQYGISRERVRQLEVRAFKRVQDAVLALAKEQGSMPEIEGALA